MWAYLWCAACLVARRGLPFDRNTVWVIRCSTLGHWQVIIWGALTIAGATPDSSSVAWSHIMAFIFQDCLAESKALPSATNFSSFLSSRSTHSLRKTCLRMEERDAMTSLLFLHLPTNASFSSGPNSNSCHACRSPVPPQPPTVGHIRALRSPCCGPLHEAQKVHM